jgi:alpha-tubulin suppressor-like RCC1 family protein
MMHFAHAIKGKVTDLACGEEHSALLTQDGEVFTFGYGMDG